jgi:hypothetical protein
LSSFIDESKSLDFDNETFLEVCCTLGCSDQILSALGLDLWSTTLPGSCFTLGCSDQILSALRLDLCGKRTTHINNPNAAMETWLGCFDLTSFVCPITNAIFDEPMLADDGRTYSKTAILAWFKCRSERQLQITSPCTRKPMSERLVPNEDIAKSIEEYRKGRKGGRSASGKAPPGLQRNASCAEFEHILESTTRSAIDATLAPKSLAELGAMFSLLDGLRQLLAETLDGWQPPQIVVVGQESSGKSSVLERLMMTPLLPRDENICTRLPIHVRLRRCDKAMPPMLEVYNTLTKTTEKGPYVISAQYGDFDVSEEMRRILTEEQGKKHTHTHTFMRLHVCMLEEKSFRSEYELNGRLTARGEPEQNHHSTRHESRRAVPGSG